MVVSPTVFTARLIHHPKLYIRVHKKHHEWRAPVAIASMYCTGTEYFLLLSAAAMARAQLSPFLYFADPVIIQNNSI
jgi:methylsterol monooxygenase